MFGKPTGGLFGNSANSTFGSTAFGASNTSGFGTGTSFSATPFGGNNQTVATGGLFGASNAGTTNLFGNTNTSGFGTSTGTSFGFGTGIQASQANTSIFGSGATTGFGASNSLFSQPAQPAIGFGQPSNLFGGGTAANTGSFMGSLGAQQQTGTTVKFVPLVGTDAMMKSGSQVNINTKLWCISAMKEYENKSLEELRYEDYMANRKSGSTFGGAGMGSFLQTSQQQPQASGYGLFANQNKPTFSGFGTSTAAGSSLFGGGTTTQAKPLFGTGTTTTTATSNAFGNIGAGSLFGGGNKTATSMTGGLFGSTAATTRPSLNFFGNPQQQQTQQAATGFGLGAQNTNTGSLFGSKPTGFGQPAAAATNFSFGSQQPTQSAFGGSLFNKPATSSTGAFGLGTQNTGLGFGGFGSTAASLGSSTGFGGLGATSTSGGLFSSQQKPGGSFFGSTAPGFGGLGTGMGTTSLGGSLGAGGNTSLLGGAGSGSIFGGSTLMAGQNLPQQQANAEVIYLQEQQRQIQQHISALNSSPYGDSPLFKNLSKDPSRHEELTRPTNPVAQQNLLNAQHKFKPTPTGQKIKTVPLHSYSAEKGEMLTSSAKVLLFDGLEDDEDSTRHRSSSSSTGETFVPRKNYKRFDIKKIMEQQRLYTSQQEVNSESRSTSPEENRLAQMSTNQHNSYNDSGKNLGTDLKFQQKPKLTNPNLTRFESSQVDTTMTELLPKARHADNSDNDDRHSNCTEPTGDILPVNRRDKSPHPAGIVSTRPDYFTVPSLEEMADLTTDGGICIVDDLIVGREGYGNVFFPGKTDVTNLNIDELIHFRRKEVEIYPDESIKPPMGEGLNKKAQVTLDRVFPIDKTTGEVITEYSRLVAVGFVEKLERDATKMGAKFIEYRPDTGSFVFLVDHFSKYSILDDSDDEDVPQNNTIKPAVEELVKLPIEKQSLSSLNKQTIIEQKATVDETIITSQQPFNQIYSSDVDKRMKSKSQFTMISEDQELDTDDYETRKSIYVVKSDYDVGCIGEDDDYMMSCAEGDSKVSHHPSSFDQFGQVSAHRVQLQKASFFGGLMDDDDDDDENTSKTYKQTSERRVSDWMPATNKSSLTSGRPSLFSAKVAAKLIGAKDVSPPSNYKKEAKKSSEMIPTSLLVDCMKSSHPTLHSMMSDEDRKYLARGSLKLKTSITKKRGKYFVPFKDSLMYKKHSLFVDIALLQGVSTRLSWGSFWVSESPGWVLAHVGSPVMADHFENGGKNYIGYLNDTSLAKQENNLSGIDDSLVVRIERIVAPASVNCKASKSIKDYLDVCLKIELKHCDVDVGERFSEDEMSDPLVVECPFFSYSEDAQSLLTEMASQLDVNQSNDGTDSQWRKTMSSIWKLCLALWGELDGVSSSHDDYHHQQLRKKQVTRWLSEHAKIKIDEELKLVEGDNTDGHVTLTYLTGCLIKEAVEAAMKVNDFHLVLLLAQATGSDDVRILLKKQLSMWADNKIDQFISKSRLAVYSLMAGMLVLRTSTNQINCCSSLDWKRCFGLHLWYGSPATCTIAESLMQYDEAFKGEGNHGKYASAPNPQYMEEWGLDGICGVQDVTYHILKLFCNKNYPLHQILNPSSFSDNVMDYSCSWHLMKLLGSLGYRHISNFHFASVCHNYASQLEAMGMWHWSAFVLMHIRHEASRRDAVKKLIMRNVKISLGDNDDVNVDECNQENVDMDDTMWLLDECEVFLVEHLKVPVEWIHEAKAIRAHSQGLHEVRAQHLFKARQYSQYHDLVVNHLASKALVEEEHTALKKWFECIKNLSGKHSLGVKYENGGSIYLNYLDLLETMERLEESVEDSNSVSNDFKDMFDKLDCLSTSLANKINCLPNTTPLDRHAQSLVAQAISRAILKLMNRDQGGQSSNEDYASHLAETQIKLPMTVDSALQALSLLSHEHLKNIIVRHIR